MNWGYDANQNNLRSIRPATTPSYQCAGAASQVYSAGDRPGRRPREHGVNAQARTYSVWSHLASVVFVQLAHAFSLNDVCNWLRLKRRAIAGFGVTPPAQGGRQDAPAAGYRLLQAVERGPVRMALRISTIPSIISGDSTTITLQEKPGNLQPGPPSVHPFPSGRSNAIAVPMGCLWT